MSGTASVEANLESSGAGVAGALPSGTVSIQVADGEIRDFPLLAVLNTVLRTNGAGEDTFPFESMTGTFHLAEGRARTDDLMARAPAGTVRAHGFVGFDSGLHLEATAVVPRERSSELIRRVRELSGLRNRDGEIEVPLVITGTIQAPVVALDARSALGRALQRELERQIEKRLKGVIRRDP